VSDNVAGALLGSIVAVESTTCNTAPLLIERLRQAVSQIKQILGDSDGVEQIGLAFKGAGSFIKVLPE